MDEVAVLIARATAARAARAEKSHAYGEIVRRFQDLAFACALSVLGDFHLAEDAAQEAFLAAWRNSTSYGGRRTGQLQREVLAREPAPEMVA